MQGRRLEGIEAMLKKWIKAGCKGLISSKQSKKLNADLDGRQAGKGQGIPTWIYILFIILQVLATLSLTKERMRGVPKVRRDLSLERV